MHIILNHQGMSFTKTFAYAQQAFTPNTMTRITGRTVNHNAIQIKAKISADLPCSVGIATKRLAHINKQKATVKAYITFSFYLLTSDFGRCFL